MRLIGSLATASLLALALPAMAADRLLTFETLAEADGFAEINLAYGPEFVFSKVPDAGSPGSFLPGDPFVVVAGSLGHFSNSHDDHALVMDDFGKWPNEGDVGKGQALMAVSVAGGFTESFGIRYTAASDLLPDSLFRVLDASGAVLASGSFSPPTPCPPGSGTNFFCNWNAPLVSFAGVATKVIISAGNGQLFIDELSFGPAPTPAVPEPSTWALGLTGLLGLGLASRRRQAAASSQR